MHAAVGQRRQWIALDRSRCEAPGRGGRQGPGAWRSGLRRGGGHGRDASMGGSAARSADLHAAQTAAIIPPLAFRIPQREAKFRRRLPAWAATGTSPTRHP
ncbi:hypothetical protein GLE_4261 [Lysobacter enzymogenes]|uniref:Uncharacterized protein n=1 Tax=Lysobacter enzymogenes TaxID=69 RepID=A0A0S2DM76_LYSEN|nr:hypothetical protein GLE_4261 [Lysobacter enzymogenes]